MYVDEMILYTTGCPKCHILTQKLDAKKMKYTICDDIEEMKRRGFASVPVLQIGQNTLTFGEAVTWLNSI